MPLALLLFLICALLASVVLAASTTAVGSYSKLSQADQRYYCVTSAADLLKGKLDGSSVTVTVEQAKASAAAPATVTKVTVDAVEASVEGSGDDSKVSIDESDLTLAQLAAMCLLMGGQQPSGGYKAETVSDIPDNPVENSPVALGSYVVDFADASEDSTLDASVKAILSASVKAAVSDAGLTLQVDSPHEEDSIDYFSLALGFDADVDVTESTRTTRDAGGVETTTITKTAVVTWAASDLTKAGA